MNDNFCFCGSQSTYPHKWDCPRPLYHGGDSQAGLWYEDRERIRAAAVRTCLRCDVRFSTKGIYNDTGLCPSCEIAEDLPEVMP